MDWAGSYRLPHDFDHAKIVDVFSTITSPVFSEFVIVLAGNAAAYLPLQPVLFQTLRRISEERPFELVFSFEGPCFVPRGKRWEPAEARWELKQALDSVTANGFLDFLDSPPTVRITTQSTRYEWDFPH